MKYRYFLGFIVAELLLLAVFFWDGEKSIERRKPEVTAKKSLVSKLQITDFAIWTEARYTRHPSQADLFTPYQDFPSSMEHFPAGSIMAPPPRSEITKIEHKAKSRSGKK